MQMAHYNPAKSILRIQGQKHAQGRIEHPTLRPKSKICGNWGTPDSFLSPRLRYKQDHTAMKKCNCSRVVWKKEILWEETNEGHGRAD